MDFKKHISLSSIVPLVIVALVWCAISYLRVGNYKDKLWAHRVNSLEKRAEFRESYPNFEVDITIRQDSLGGALVLDVTHDEDTTFGLTFDEYLPELGKSEKVWLDVKNLSLDNNSQVLSKLDSLISAYGLYKQQFIVETRDYKALELLTKNGYYTSYYVDFKKIDAEVAAHLDEVAGTGFVKALSFPSTQYGDIKDRVSNKDVDFLTWAHRDTQFQFLLNPLNLSMLDDARLKVILIKTRGHFHR